MHINQSTLRSNANSMTPLEAFFRQKPDLKYIRIFGCICFALFHPTEHAHLSPRAKRGIFSGLRWSEWPRWNECHFRIKDKSMLPQNKTTASIYRINIQCLKMVFSIRWMLLVTPPKKMEAGWTTKISCGKMFEALNSKTKQHSIALGEKFRRWLLIMEGKLFRMNFNHGLKHQGYITWQQLGVSQIITPS